MNGDPQFEFDLATHIDAITNDAIEEAARAMSDADRETSRTGRVNSPYSVGQKNRALIATFRRASMEMADMISIAEHLDATERLSRLIGGARQLADRLAEVARNDYSQTAGGPTDREFFSRAVEELRQRLNADIESLGRDFPTDTVWEQPIAPLPSPLEMVHHIHADDRQTGVGAVVNQSMPVQQAMEALVAAISAVRTSKDYAALDVNSRQQLDEIADGLIKEARARAPNASRIKQWGDRFIAGLRAAA